MTNEELEFFIEKYISVRVKVGKSEYDSKLVRQVMMAAAFYVREQQRKIDTNNACEWLKNYRQETPDGLGYIPGIVNDQTIDDFCKAMEDRV